MRRIMMPTACLLLSAACVSGPAEVPISNPAAGSHQTASSPVASKAEPVVTGERRADVPDGINDGWIERNGEQAAQSLERETREVFAARHEIVSALNLKSGQSIADIGAGSGLFTRLFSDAVGSQGAVYAVDIGEKMLEYIAEQARATGRKNIETILGTATSTRLAPDTVDLVFVSDTYHHFEYPQAMLASIRAALRTNGRLAIIDFYRIEGTSPGWIMQHVRAGREVVIREIEAAGFRQVEDIALDGLKENYFVMFEKSAPAALSEPS